MNEDQAVFGRRPTGDLGMLGNEREFRGLERIVRLHNQRAMFGQFVGVY
jgi:hypothetical protein